MAAYLRYETARSRVPLPRRQPVPGLHRRRRGPTRSTSRSTRRARQHRLKTLFRIFLAMPGVLARLGPRSAALGGRRSSAWFAALFTRPDARGLRNLGAYCLRYNAQTYAYRLLLTDSYPYSGPDRATWSREDEPEDRPDGQARCPCRRPRSGVAVLAAPVAWLAAWLALADVERPDGLRLPDARARGRARASRSSARRELRALRSAGATSSRRSSLIAALRRLRALRAYASCGSRRPAGSAPGCCSACSASPSSGSSRSRSGSRPLVAAPPRRLRARLRRLALPELVRARRRVPVRLPRAPDRHGPRRAAPRLVVDPRRGASSSGSPPCSPSSRRT